MESVIVIINGGNAYQLGRSGGLEHAPVLESGAIEDGTWCDVYAPDDQAQADLALALLRGAKAQVALKAAEAFIAGFEDDDMQDVKALLASVRECLV
jgi:hypothetical protein